MTKETCEKRVYAAFAAHGLEIVKRPMVYMWDGKTETYQAGKEGHEHMLHDLAHWIIAPSRRRKVPEFGLGAGPETDYDVHPQLLVSRKRREDEESKASLLGIALQMRLGMPWRATLDEHNWLSEDPRPTLKKLGRLINADERKRIEKVCLR